MLILHLHLFILLHIIMLYIMQLLWFTDLFLHQYFTILLH